MIHFYEGIFFFLKTNKNSSAADATTSVDRQIVIATDWFRRIHRGIGTGWDRSYHGGWLTGRRRYFERAIIQSRCVWMLTLAMTAQIDFTLKSFVAEITLEWLVTGVFTHVRYQIATLGESFLANDALVWLFTCWQKKKSKKKKFINLFFNHLILLCWAGNWLFFEIGYGKIRYFNSQLCFGILIKSLIDCKILF